MRDQRSETEAARGGVVAQRAPGPRGVGTAVAFDWGLTAQLLLTAPFLVVGVGPGAQVASSPLALRIAAAGASALVALAPFALGEALRRGSRLARWLQLALNALVTLGGLALIPGAIASVRQGRFGLLVRVIIMAVVSPIILWLLTRPQTRDWFAHTSAAEARARHGGRWLLEIALCALIGGAAIAFEGAY